MLIAREPPEDKLVDADLAAAIPARHADMRIMKKTHSK